MTSAKAARPTDSASAKPSTPSGPAAKPQADSLVPSEPVAVTAPKQATHARTGTALAALALLAVKGRAAKTGYDRSLFGQAWSDDVAVQGGHNGCDTRNDVLRRDLRGVGLKPRTQGCVALTGTLADPYTGTAISFLRGQGTSSRVQIGHIVALSNAWQTGAGQLAPERRQNLANDPLNLWAVQGRANLQKSDGDAATWLPANKSVRCLYVARQVAVKSRYGLWVTPPERDAMERILRRCPDQRLPATAEWATPAPDRNAANAVVPHAAKPEPSARPTRKAPPSPSPSPAPTTRPVPLVATPTPTPAASRPAPSAIYYQNCTAVRAAHADPIHRGQPGYAKHLDRDGDGVGCE